MIAPGIGIVLGLIVLFLGMALLTEEKKQKKKKAAEKETKIGEAANETALAEALVDNEEKVLFADIRRAKLGATMVAQGVLLTLVGIAFIILHRFVVPIAWYISVPAIVLLLVASFLADAYLMGDKTLMEVKREETDEPSFAASTEEEACASETQEVGECTEKTADDAADDSEG